VDEPDDVTFGPTHIRHQMWFDLHSYKDRKETSDHRLIEIYSTRMMKEGESEIRIETWLWGKRGSLKTCPVG